MPKVLVIENEPSIQKLVQANLFTCGYQVVTVISGEEGLEHARANCPDLILLDLRLPGMSGWDVLTTLKTDAMLCKIPVIVMTASVQPNQAERAFSMGATGYLAKPFAAVELLCQVKPVLEKRYAPSLHSHR